MVVLGAGTGGTITGVARKLKSKCPNVQVKYIRIHLLNVNLYEYLIAIVIYTAFGIS